MTTLSAMDKRNFEDLFDMNTGYVINFSNSSFQQFIKASINIDIYEDLKYSEHTSKANKLRQVWNQEPTYLVGKLMLDLLDYFENYKLKQNKLSEFDKKMIEKLRIVSTELSNNKNNVKLPVNKDYNLNVLQADIEQSLSQNKPILCIDRLHTFTVRFIREICNNNNIEIKSDKGKFYSLQSLIGKLAKTYENDNLFQSNFHIVVIKSSISLFESFNDIRNNKSFAHDNDIIGDLEATYIVKSISELLIFIDKIENLRQKITNSQEAPKEDDYYSDIPF
ncbi:MAG: abortive infection family protein [Sphaerochaetaceae bacterium]|nr:abortive infection family protein [Sphaerochaetaceae bacterium]MDC7238162.1 abortive infection family protein [Sphaerochaetaceae bacterium]